MVIIAVPRLVALSHGDMAHCDGERNCGQSKQSCGWWLEIFQDPGEAVASLNRHQLRSIDREWDGSIVLERLA
jgi:hypothetical protein